MNDLVSVIVLTWNRLDLLKETIDSILKQTYQNFELLIIDNESTDGTLEYISNLNKEKIKYYRNPNNGILSVNRNFGINRAQGRYIAFCDDDDLWLPNRLARQMEFLNQNPKYKIVCSNGIYFNASGDIDCLIKDKNDGELTLRDFLRGRNYVVLPTVLINKEVFSDVGLYNEDPGITNTEDYEFMVRAAALKKPIFFINECLVKYRVHDLMTSHSNSLMTINKEKYLFNNLYKNKILNQAEYKIISHNLKKKYIIAGFKEVLKKSKIIKNLVYMFRRARLNKSNIN